MHISASPYTDRQMKRILLAFLLTAAALAQSPQNPSPMVEHTRTHQRQPEAPPPGRREKLSIGTLYLPEESKNRKTVPLLIHFHGSTWLPEQSVHKQNRRAAVLTVQLGAGSGVYAKPFQEPNRFKLLLAEAQKTANLQFEPIYLSGFSAGYGAIREILREFQPAGVLLIDGLHTGYDPEGKPGPLKPEGLRPFLDFAQEAAAGHKRMLITHSEIFPGTFASTTETADYLLNQLGLKRTPVVKWGPFGTQQLSVARKGNFELLGFAGNSAPDHVDQLHSLADWLKRLKF
jgi:hypothetical protein